ncbi:MAG: hypothetical protein ABEJ58_00050 [Halodesulfurarchaeum sp.]
MAVTPIDSTDQRIIQLVSELGDPLVRTQQVAAELDIGYQDTQARLEMLAENGWVSAETDHAEPMWQVSAKASLLVRTEGTSLERQDQSKGADSIIEAEAEDSNGGD